MKQTISLAAARVNANMTQREVAKMLDVTAQTIINWEKGRSEPTVSQSMKLAELYDFPYDCIFMPK